MKNIIQKIIYSNYFLSVIYHAIDASKINNDIGWKPKENFESGLKKTIEWYLNSSDWIERVISGEYILKRQGILND